VQAAVQRLRRRMEGSLGKDNFGGKGKQLESAAQAILKGGTKRPEKMERNNLNIEKGKKNVRDFLLTDGRFTQALNIGGKRSGGKKKK